MGTRIRAISKIAEDIKLDHPELSEYELLSLAIQEQRNEILQAGLNVSREDLYPPSLTAIAMQLGFNSDSGPTVLNSLNEIREALIADKKHPEKS